MNGIVTDSIAAKEHPLIKEFIKLVDAVAVDGVLDFNDILAPQFTQFYRHFIIFKRQEEIDDFNVILFGTHVVSAYGSDCTGKLMSEMGFDDAFETIRDNNVNVINNLSRAYNSGDLYWQNRDFKKYDLVRVPLRRKGCVNETLTCVVHS